MSQIEADALIAATGTNTALSLRGKGTGKVALGDGSLLVPDADGAAGQILTTDGSANLAFAATPGTSGNVLTSNGSAWTSAAAAGGGAWTLIGTALASDSASVTITGLDNTYIAFAIVLADIDIGTDDASLYFRVGDSSGIDSGVGDYAWYTAKGAESATTWAGTNDASDTEIHINSALGIGYDDLEYLNCIAYIFRGTTSTSRTSIHGQYTFIQMDGVLQTGIFGGFRQDAIDLTQVQIIPSTGDIDAGRMSVYGIKHT